jgi:hypothetical protein
MTPVLWRRTTCRARIRPSLSPEVPARLISHRGVDEDGLATVDISKLTTVKVLNKRSSSSGVEYKCELEPLRLAADLVERVQMGRVHIRIRERTCTRQTT